MATLAHAIGIEVVGEGVENLEQQDALAKLGVYRVQGWLYAKALPQDEFLALVAKPPVAMPVEG